MHQLELRGNIAYEEPTDPSDTATAVIFFIPELWIDEQPLVDFTSYGMFLHELNESTLRSGQFFIITCSCGMPECAGIYHPVTVTYEVDTITWTVRAPIERTLVFARQPYQQAITNGIAQLRRDWADLQAMAADGLGVRLELVPGLIPDEALLRTIVRQPGVKRKRQQG